LDFTLPVLRSQTQFHVETNLRVQKQTSQGKKQDKRKTK